MNADWPRWIKASLFEYLRANNATTIPFFIEGAERKTSDRASWFELRMDGPECEEQSKDYWHVEIEVNVLCSATIGNDLYEIDRMMGAVMKLVDAAIPVFKYGDGPFDDQSQIGCLRVKSNPRHGAIQPHYYGQIEPKIKLVQATVEVRYWIELTED